MSSSTEWSDAQLRLLINERKQRNSEYHATPNKKKRAFWDDVANKLNEQENTNYFLGGDCHKKFLNLTKAFNTAKRYREGGVKKSLVGEKIYEEFSTLFWLKPELSFDQQHNESIRRKSGTSSSSEPSTTAGEQSSSSSKQPERSPGESSSPKVVKNSKETPVTPSTVEPPISTFGGQSHLLSHPSLKMRTLLMLLSTIITPVLQKKKTRAFSFLSLFTAVC